MLRRNTAIVITVLMIGNVAVSLQAASFELLPELRSTSSENSAESRIADLLHERGLEHAAAVQKARALFANTHTPTLGELQYLCDRLNGLISMKQLEEVLARRALFEKGIDLASAEGLIGLVHEATGTAPDAKAIQRLREVAQINHTLNG